MKTQEPHGTHLSAAVYYGKMETGHWYPQSRLVKGKKTGDSLSFKSIVALELRWKMRQFCSKTKTCKNPQKELVKIVQGAADINFAW